MHVQRYHGQYDAQCKDSWSSELTDNNGTHIAGAQGVNGTYSTRVFTSYTVNAIVEHFAASSSADEEKVGSTTNPHRSMAIAPLYIYLAHEATHDIAGGGIQACVRCFPVGIWL